MLRYLSTSLAGTSETGESVPRKEQIRMLQFYNENWKDFEDYIGPKPPEDPTTWITVRPDGTFPHYRYAPYGQKTGKGFETWGCPNNPLLRADDGRADPRAGRDRDRRLLRRLDPDRRRHLLLQVLPEELRPPGSKRTYPHDVAKARYGTSDYEHVRLPQKRGEPFWMEYITFRCDTVAGFHRRLREVARKYNPHFMISGNVFGGFGYGPIAYDAAGNMELLGRDGYDDFIYSEIQEFLDSAPRKNDSGDEDHQQPRPQVPRRRPPTASRSSCMRPRSRRRSSPTRPRNA